MNVRELLNAGRTPLADPAEARREAEILLGDALGVNRAWLFANPEHVPRPDQATRYQTMLQRRAQGEPVAYLTGRREFWSMTLKVSPGVLIPRPETELLVETVLAHVPTDSPWRIADLGTGCGAVALAIAVERPMCEVHATDISLTALDIAAENSREITQGRVLFHHGSWLEALKGRFHVIASNPPYIVENDPHLSQGDLRFEPAAALVSGQDGLSAIRAIASGAEAYLEQGGLLAFEHGFDQGYEVRKLLAEHGYVDIVTRKDMENRERVTSGKKTKNMGSE